MNKKNLSKAGKIGAQARWAKKNQLLKELEQFATAYQMRYVRKLREKSLFAVGEIILGLAKK